MRQSTGDSQIPCTRDELDHSGQSLCSPVFSMLPIVRASISGAVDTFGVLPTLFLVSSKACPHFARRMPTPPRARLFPVWPQMLQRHTAPRCRFRKKKVDTSLPQELCWNLLTGHAASKEHSRDFACVKHTFCLCMGKFRSDGIKMKNTREKKVNLDSKSWPSQMHVCQSGSARRFLKKNSATSRRR